MNWLSGFLESWPLLWHGWVVGWLVALTLAIPGVLVVARERIFIGAAVAQASAFGVAVGLWLVPADPHGPWWNALLPAALAIAAAIAAALGVDTGRGRRSSAGARTGWIWLAAGAGTVLVLSGNPYGAHGMERLIASSLLGAGDGDVVVFALLATATLALAAALRDRLAVLAIDPAWAPLAGMRRARWEAGVAIWLGLAVGLAIRSTGLLYAFGCLVVPALAARTVCREVRTQFLVAPLLGLGGAVVAFVVADRRDLPPAQLAVGLLCALVPALAVVAAVVRRMRRTAAARSG